ncbi:MAG: serine/threonine-protein kinase [Nannocystaceae bacterium]
MIGRSIIGQFVVRSKLGMGGMGAVYLADQPTVGRTAVIKVIHPWLSKDRDIAERFAAEARAAARLQNPHIVAIYNYGKLPDGTLFLAMEHIHGTTLAESLQSHGRVDPSRAVNIAAQCCEALAEAHRHGVVHRDVKPSNIMLQKRRQGPGFVKMLDFGVATIDERDTAPGGKPAGTPCYMSPEQLAGKPADGRSDIYSLAIVIYEMIVGQPPFLAPSPEEYARLHREVPPPAPSGLAPEVAIPPTLEACLMRALAKEPHARPQTAERFSDELWDALSATASTVGQVSMPHELFIPRPPPRRRSRLVLVGLLGAVALGVGATVWVLRDREPAPSAETKPLAPAEQAEQLGQADVPPSGNAEALRQVLMADTVVELEAELERAAVLSGRDAEALNVAMTNYQRSAYSPPPGIDSRTHRRALLADTIVSWVSDPSPTPSAASIAELEAVFLRMRSPLEIEERREMLRELSLREGPNPARIRARLLEWIEQRGLDYLTGEPGAELVLEDDPSSTSASTESDERHPSQ